MALRPLFMLLNLAFAMAACEPTSITIPVNDQLAGTYNILPTAKGAAVLEQCSRDTPAKGTRYFVVDPDTIISFEKQLVLRLSTDGFFKHMQDDLDKYDPDPTRPPLTLANYWGRDLLGIERDGKKFVYGNYYPLRDGDTQSKNSEPTIVCDGGEIFFGAEFDVSNGIISHLAFNGFV
jgi:hypothetical protein